MRNVDYSCLIQFGENAEKKDSSERECTIQKRTREEDWHWLVWVKLTRWHYLKYGKNILIRKFYSEQVLLWSDVLTLNRNLSAHTD